MLAEADATVHEAEVNLDAAQKRHQVGVSKVGNHGHHREHGKSGRLGEK